MTEAALEAALEASRGMHLEVGWTWRRGARASVSDAARILASVQRAAPGPSLLFAPRFARVLRAGVTFPVVLAPAKAGEYCTIAAGVWRDGELIALVMPCVPPWSGDRSPQRIDINGRSVRWEVT